MIKSYFVEAAVITLLMGTAVLAEEFMVQGVARNLTVRQEGEEELEQLMDLLAIQYSRTCLMVEVGDTGFFDSYWGKPRIVINSNSSQAKSTVEFINEYTQRVTTHACVTYLIKHLPGTELFSVITDVSKKQTSRYFIAHATSVLKAHEFLLDVRLSKEEHVAALVKEEDHRGSFWQVLTRQLLHPSGSPHVLHANEWSKDKGFYNTDELFPEQMGNFYGMKLIGVTLDFRPFTDYEVIPGSRRVNPKPSLDVFILNEIAKRLNFTYDLIMPEDGLWGVLKDNGHWVGVVGDVEFGRANFSLVLSVTLERRMSVDFTRSYYLDPLTFVTAKKRPQPPWLKLITPFSGQVWVASLMSVVVATVLYHFVFRTQGTFGFTTLTPSGAFIYVFGSFLSQPLPSMPWFSAGKVLLGFWLVYAFLLTTYYKTSLTAALAVPSTPPTIDTLDQLLHSDLKFGMIDAKGSEYQLFSMSNVSLYQKLFKRMTFYSSSESMKRVAEGKYAYIYFKSNLQSIISTQYTSLSGETLLHLASEEFFPGGYGWAFPKGALYRRTFDNIMWRCVQAGLINKWLKDLYAVYLEENMEQQTPEERKQLEAVAQAPRDDDGRVVLSLNHLQGPFLILLLGSALGVLFLLSECVIDRFLCTVTLNQVVPQPLKDTNTQ
ncbi:glutamate receptor U1-like [Cherax quadricarinatus]|uniref:glutamate receptor U1-like n=1 Tax=Cherax quadricarinatus TaxID=27406 RepID=UPI00387E503F